MGFNGQYKLGARLPGSITSPLGSNTLLPLGSNTLFLAIKMFGSPTLLTGHIFYRCKSPWFSKDCTQQLLVINSDIPLPSSQGLLRAKGLWLQRFTPPWQGLTSSGSHYCLRTTCQSVRTCCNGFEVDCSAHGEGDAVFIE